MGHKGSRRISNLIMSDRVKVQWTGVGHKSATLLTTEGSIYSLHWYTTEAPDIFIVYNVTLLCSLLYGMYLSYSNMLTLAYIQYFNYKFCFRMVCNVVISMISRLKVISFLIILKNIYVGLKVVNTARFLIYNGNLL